MVIIAILNGTLIVEANFRNIRWYEFALLGTLLAIFMEDFILELVDMPMFLQSGQIGGHGVDLPINFLFNFQQLLLFLQL